MKYFVAIIIILLIILYCLGCANLDYGDLHWSRVGNWKSGAVIFAEHIEDPNGYCSDVAIIIIGPDINHDKLAGEITKGFVKGLLSK